MTDFLSCTSSRSQYDFGLLNPAGLSAPIPPPVTVEPVGDWKVARTSRLESLLYTGRNEAGKPLAFGQKGLD